MTRAILLTLGVSIALAGVAQAKGGPSYLSGATVSGAGMTSPVSVGISLPDNDRELRVIYAAANGGFGYAEKGSATYELQQLLRAVLRQSEADALSPTAAPSPVQIGVTMPYGVVLHFDFERWGGEKELAGLYDGHRLLYFPSGIGYYASGWYEASPRLAEELRWATAPAEWRYWRGQHDLEPYAPEIVASLLFLTLWVIGGRTWRGDNQPASPVEVEQRMMARPTWLGSFRF